MLIFASADSALAARWLIRAWFASVAFGLIVLAWSEYRESRGLEP